MTGGTNDDERQPEDRTIPFGDASPDPKAAGAGDFDAAGPPLPRVPGVTLQRELARGGMGIVYVGRQDFLDRTVAVKLLSIDLQNDQFAARFHREAKLLAGIKHANIVACHDAGATDEGLYYLVMEYIDGPNLKNWLASNGPFPVPVALDMTKAIARALDHAYGLGVIHRDVKPENILLETATSTQLNAMTPFIPKLVDLGLARMQSDNAGLGLTSPGAVMGTPTTMSPEQFDDPDSVDFRTDIYGLGCAFYEMLTGKPAYAASKLTDLVVTKRNPLGPNPCEPLDWLSPRVGDLVSRMLAANREQRPESYAALIAEIDTLGAEFSAAGNAAPPTGPTASANEPAAARSDTEFNPDVTRGILRSTELNFLAQELGGEGEAQPPASPFRESEIDEGTTAPTPVAATPSPTPPPGKKNRVALIAGAIVLAAGIGGAIWFFGQGDGSQTDPGKTDPQNANATPRTNQSAPANGKPTPSNLPPSTPVIAGPTTFALQEPQTLRAAATDPEGDKLRYEWRSPQSGVVFFTAGASAETPVMVHDGLPGEKFTVEVAVDDGHHEPIIATQQIEVAPYEPKPLLAGAVSDDSVWTLDDPIGWNQANEDLSLRGSAKDTPRVMRRSLGSEAYWHITGFVEPTRFSDPNRFGVAGTRIEAGDRSWRITVKRSGNGGADWSAELTEETKASGEWQRTSTPAVRADWHDADGACEGALVSLKRAGEDLTIQFGCAESKEFEGRTIRGAAPTGSEVGMALFVNMERGVFRDFKVY